jgi:hypothetical protein
MGEATATALTPDPAQPVTLDSLYEAISALRALQRPPDEVRLTPIEWATLRASPEVARTLHYPAGPEEPFRLCGLPVRLVASHDLPVTP